MFENKINTISVRCRIVDDNSVGLFYRICNSKEANELLKGRYSSFNLTKKAREPYNEVCFSFEYKGQTVNDLYKAILESFGLDPERLDVFEVCVWPELLIEAHPDFVLKIDNENMQLSSLIEKLNINEIEAFLVIYLSEGTFLREGGFRFYFNSHEGNKHNRAHIHVQTSDDREGSIDIVTLEQNKGSSLNKREMKRIKTILANRQKELIDAWNLQTDGINVDLDILLGQSEIKGK